MLSDLLLRDVHNDISASLISFTPSITSSFGVNFPILKELQERHENFLVREE